MIDPNRLFITLSGVNEGDLDCSLSVLRSWPTDLWLVCFYGGYGPVIKRFTCTDDSVVEFQTTGKDYAMAFFVNGSPVEPARLAVSNEVTIRLPTGKEAVIGTIKEIRPLRDHGSF